MLQAAGALMADNGCGIGRAQVPLAHRRGDAGLVGPVVGVVGHVVDVASFIDHRPFHVGLLAQPGGQVGRRQALAAQGLGAFTQHAAILQRVAQALAQAGGVLR